MQYGGTGGVKVMGLRAHSVQETSLLGVLSPVCDLGAALPRATAHASTPPTATTEANPC